MKQVRVIEKNDQRVLTSSQLAEAYGTDIKTISNNFTRNKKRYVEGKHFYTITGDELKEFKTIHQIDDKLKHSPILYLWTVKGALHHAKSLGTDEAWQKYEELVDDYFNKVEAMSGYGMKPAIPTTIEGILELAVLNMKDLRTKLDKVEADNRHLQLVVDNELVLTKQQRGAIRNAVMSRQGQLNAEGYTQKHFQAIYRAINQHFGVAEYADINRNDFERAMNIIKGWYPKKAEE